MRAPLYNDFQETILIDLKRSDFGLEKFCSFLKCNFEQYFIIKLICIFSDYRHSTSLVVNSTIAKELARCKKNELYATNVCFIILPINAIFFCFLAGTSCQKGTWRWKQKEHKQSWFVDADFTQILIWARLWGGNEWFKDGIRNMPYPKLKMILS